MQASKADLKILENLPTIFQIQEEIAKHFGINQKELIGPRRSPHINYPRQVAIHLIYQWKSKAPCCWGYPTVIKYFGRKNHTTALHADRKIKRLLIDDPHTQAHVEYLRMLLGI